MRNIAIVCFVAFCSLVWYLTSWRQFLRSFRSDATKTKDCMGCDVSDLQKRVSLLQKAFKCFTKDTSSSYLNDLVATLSPYFKIYITFFQILSSFMTFGVQWPSLLLSMMLWIKGTLFRDVLTLPGLSCLWTDVSFTSRLMLYTLGPLFVLLLFLAPVILSLASGYHKLENTWRTVSNAAWKNIMVWLFLVFPVVSLTTLQAFDCQPTGLGRLAADFNEPCPSYHDFLSIWSFIFIMVYPFGVPLFCYWSMLSMGVHIVAKDILNHILLRALVAEYQISGGTTLSPSGDALWYDAKIGVCITKKLAIDMLLFDWRKLKKNQTAMSLDPFRSTVYNADITSGTEGDQTEFERLKWNNMKKSDIANAVLNLAKSLKEKNVLSTRQISWSEVKEPENLKSKRQVEEPGVDKDTADEGFSQYSYGYEAPDNKEECPISKFDCVLHPDLEDYAEWDLFTKIQTFVGTCSMNISENWTTVKQRVLLKQNAIVRVGFIFAAYRVEFWFWEMFEMLRKYVFAIRFERHNVLSLSYIFHYKSNAESFYCIVSAGL